MHELVVAIDAPSGIGRVAFTVSVDPGFLQIRSAGEGDWGNDAGVTSSFTAEIGSAEDQVVIQSELAGGTHGKRSGSIAVVQFEAVAPGTVTITVSGVSMSDPAGRAIPFAEAPLTATAEILSGPI
jgi:hypothetical protein